MEVKETTLYKVSFYSGSDEYIVADSFGNVSDICLEQFGTDPKNIERCGRVFMEDNTEYKYI